MLAHLISVEVVSNNLTNILYLFPRLIDKMSGKTGHSSSTPCCLVAGGGGPGRHPVYVRAGLRGPVGPVI